MSISQLLFFRKNWADFERSNVTVTASQDAGSTAAYILDRSNRTAWGTVGSVDSDNTQLVISMGDVGNLDSLILIGHNFKNFLIEYYNDATTLWVSLENITNCTDTTSYYSFAQILSSQIRITITGTQVANSDKILQQFIVTSKIGQFNGWPILKSPILGRNIQEQKMLSGKSYVSQSVGYYEVSATVSNLSNASDLALVESLQMANEGFLFWPCGGNETQFASVRKGYSLQDIFLVRCKSEFSPEYVAGLYKTGQKVQLDMVEVIT